jgi:hypothetical protein
MKKLWYTLVFLIAASVVATSSWVLAFSGGYEAPPPVDPGQIGLETLALPEFPQRVAAEIIDDREG